jgi:hypothetical protein
VTETPLRFCSYFTTQCLGQRDGEGAARRREECREETGRRAERAGTQEGKAAASPFYANYYSSFHELGHCLGSDHDECVCAGRSHGNLRESQPAACVLAGEVGGRDGSALPPAHAACQRNAAVAYARRHAAAADTVGY